MKLLSENDELLEMLIPFEPDVNDIVRKTCLYALRDWIHGGSIPVPNQMVAEEIACTISNLQRELTQTPALPFVEWSSKGPRPTTNIFLLVAKVDEEQWICNGKKFNEVEFLLNKRITWKEKAEYLCHDQFTSTRFPLETFKAKTLSKFAASYLKVIAHSQLENYEMCIIYLDLIESLKQAYLKALFTYADETVANHILLTSAQTELDDKFFPDVRLTDYNASGA